VDAGVSIDLVPGESPACGRAPGICLSDFETNLDMQDLSDTLVYQGLIQQVHTSGKSVRVFPARDILNDVSGLFSGESAALQKISNNNIITGCASRLVIPKRPDIYQIKTFYQP
jgi:hypothetical protein